MRAFASLVAGVGHEQEEAAAVSRELRYVCEANVPRLFVITDTNVIVGYHEPIIDLTITVKAADHYHLKRRDVAIYFNTVSDVRKIRSRQTKILEH